MAKRTRRQGFTIIELAIVLLIISILSSIAIPRLSHAFKRARAVEAVQTLAAIERAMKEHLGRTGEYPSAAGTQNPPDAGFDKRPMNTALPGWKELGFTPDAMYRYRYKFTPTRDASGKFTKLTLEARADTDSNGNFGHFVRIYEDGALVDETVTDD